MNERFNSMDKRFNSMDEKFNKVDERLGSLEKETTRIISVMVTKDYLDDKLSDLKGDLVILMRKEDVKLKTLVKILHAKKIINENDKNKIFSLEPFPELKLAG
ncbi:MAG: hypothetical protein U9M94_03345 [Patescibacteria group bacterium]|nr:hypothetical protein [Patescibacteria group bacterium]